MLPTWNISGNSSGPGNRKAQKTVIDVTWNAWAGLLAGWLLTYAMHSTLLLGLAWLLTRQRPFSAYHRADILWKAALVGGLITASAQTVLGIVPVAGQIRLPLPINVIALQDSVPIDSVPAGAQAMAIMRRGEDHLSMGWPIYVVGPWLVGAAVSMLHWLIRRMRLELFLRRNKRRSLAGSSLAFMLRRLCRTS